ncbi:pre-mRNA 3'-end-processing factor FIP1 isoform X3 [Acanthopagrus latus]|uniref:pre-mRNA 3'-end-processing factor FIP1 isoform X3 n=1 Tax=Acanthopagrus latus TaxID=8177 RepID=UPI00187C0880|nr:pre-mRNA 3'-end-processing factor FIP1 isoform X3 [Acanthopagrus latus]
MVSDSESDSKVVTEDEDQEEQIYQWIYGMKTTCDKQEGEEDQILPSSRPSPVHLKNIAEGDDSEQEATHKTIQAERQKDQEGDNTVGSDMDALICIQQIPVLKAKVQEKPWLRPGADISDYFNYGFDEESWKTYCRKQLKLRTSSQKLYTQIMAENWKNTHGKKGSCSAYASSDSRTTHASRQSSAAIDVIGERPGRSSRVEGCTHLRIEGNNTQVLTKMSPEEGRITSNNVPHPSKVNSLFAYTTHPAILYRQRPPPSSSHATFDSGYSKVFKPSTATSSGVPSLIPRGISTGVIETAKAWECYIRQEMCDSYRGRTRQYGHDKESKRGRERDREDCSFSYNSGEKHMRPRETTERGHKHQTPVSFNRKGEKWQRERRHTDKRGEPRSSCSSNRSRSNGGEDRDSQRRHRNKKAKRIRKDKESSKVSSAEQERKLKCD